MDPRLDIPKALGYAAEKPFLLRNLGGRVTTDIFHGLIFCTRLADVTDIGIIHHTDCRLQQFTREELALKTGTDIDFKPFSDPEKSILEDIQELGNYRILNPRHRVWGGVYSIDDHTVRVIADSNDYSLAVT